MRPSRRPLSRPLSAPYTLATAASNGGGGVLTGGTLEPETTALLARFTTPATPQRQLLINGLISALVSSGIWAKLDAFYVMAAADEQAAQRNWVADTFNLTPTNTPTFTVDRGYQGNGSTSFLDTGFNPTTASAPKFTQNDAHMLIWSRTSLRNGAAVSYDAGNANSRVARRSNVVDGVPADGVYRSNLAGDVVSGTGYPGYVGWARSAAAVWEAYRNGADSGGGTNASAALSNASFYALARNSGEFGTNQLAAYHFGGNLTAGQVSAVYNALNVYMVNVGAA